MNGIYQMTKDGKIKLGRFYSVEIAEMLNAGNGGIDIQYYQLPNQHLIGLLRFRLVGPYHIILDGVNLECPHQVCKVNVYKKKTGYVMKIKPVIG